VAESKANKRKSSKRSSGGKSSSGSKGASSNKGASRSSSNKSSSKSSGNSRASRRGSKNDRSPREVVMEAVEQVQELIGRRVEAVTGMEKDGSDWTITVEVVELARIPNTTDVLGKYEVTLDRNGEVTSARRTRRYYRSEAGED
jgi:hypothetical protein